MSPIDSWWLGFWEWFAIIGFLLVIIGCVIEGVEHFVHFKGDESPKRKRIEKLGWLILVVGLTMEFLGDNQAKRIADRENSRLTGVAAQALQDAGAANERAAVAKREAAQANERTAELKLSAAEINRQAAPRGLTPDQDLALVKELVKTPSNSVTIIVTVGDCRVPIIFHT